MLVTEKEARDLWCPMVRLAKASDEGDVTYGQTVFNRVETNSGDHTQIGIPDATRCIGSRCAMWRSRYDKGYCGLTGTIE